MTTIPEKMLEGEEGEYVTRSVDRVMIHDGNAPLIFDDMEDEKIWDPEKVTTVVDHFCPPSTEERADFVKRFRDFVKEKGIKDHAESEGICHQVMCEGRVKPGEIVAGIDSHSTMYGALGAFGVGFGASDTVEILKKGEIWLKVPETIKVEIEDGEDHTDIALAILDELKYEGNYRFLEFVDKTGIKMDGRMTICNMAAETGAKSAVFPPDELTREYLRRFDMSSSFSFPGYDEDDHSENINISIEEPLLAKPHRPYNVDKVYSEEGKTIDQVFLGSCASGRLSDLKTAVEVLEGKKVHEDVRFLVTPASKLVMTQALEKGFIQKLVDAGAVILNPSCGPCPGIDKGLMAKGERCLTTQNRNYPGRMGGGDIFIANAEVCARSALNGFITTGGAKDER